MSNPEYREDYVKAPTVKDFPKEEQPRERLLKYGVSSLSTADLFAIILRTGLPNYPITDLCRDLMKMNDGKILNLERKSRAQIMELKGIGPLKAMQIEAIMEIVRRYSRETIGEKFQIKSSSDIYTYMKPEIANLPHEEMWVLFLNRRNQVIGKQRVSQGSGTGTVFDIKKILRNALLEHAESLIICHNHPSGNTQPSGADDNITRMCRDACKVMEIRMLDHIILTTDGYYSYNDSSSILG